jgi:hypothetical protein
MLGASKRRLILRAEGRARKIILRLPCGLSYRRKLVNLGDLPKQHSDSKRSPRRIFINAFQILASLVTFVSKLFLKRRFAALFKNGFGDG